MAAGDIWSLTDVYQVNGQPAANVWYIEAIDDAAATDEEAAASDAFNSVIDAAIANILSNQVEWECHLIRKVFPTTAPARTIAIVRSGSVGANAMPATAALALRHYADDGRKSRRGRHFIAGVSEIWIGSGRVEQDKDGLLMAVADAVVANVVSGGNTYRLKHYAKSENVYYDIESAMFDPVPTRVRNRTPATCSIT